MRDLLLKWWLWFFGPSYYRVQMAGYLAHSGVALSRCEQYGGDPSTGVFTSYDSASRYWQSRQHEPGQPGFLFSIERLYYENPQHRDAVLAFYHHNPEVPKSWA